MPCAQLIEDPRGFATLWLDRPERRNALDAALIDELNTHLQAVAARPHLRFLLLRGRGEHFSAGADLAWMQAAAQLDYAANLADAQALGELLYRLDALPLPTLAVVQGAAFGGALGLISACDLALGSTDALFCLSEVRLGLAPAVISPFVARALGPRQAQRYALSAERFDGQRALALGLLSDCLPADQLEAGVEAWIARLLANGPQAMRATKALLRACVDPALTPAALRELTETTIARLRVSAEGQEGLHAFLDKRQPSWQERQP